MLAAYSRGPGLNTSVWRSWLRFSSVIEGKFQYGTLNLGCDRLFFLTFSLLYPSVSHGCLKTINNFTIQNSNLNFLINLWTLIYKSSSVGYGEKSGKFTVFLEAWLVKGKGFHRYYPGSIPGLANTYWNTLSCVKFVYKISSNSDWNWKRLE